MSDPKPLIFDMFGVTNMPDLGYLSDPDFDVHVRSTVMTD